jgi:DNA topoisomerase-3
LPISAKLFAAVNRASVDKRKFLRKVAAQQMGKALIIAEKPSVASDISKALGKFQKHDDYFENDEYVISSAVGHLLELIVPEQFEVKKGKWSFANLPVIPPHFDLQPIERNENRLKVLKKLIKRDDVTELINACDAGREGELIFRNIVRYTKAKQPSKRLWLQSMTPAAIREGFAALKTDESMLPLSDAATSRAEADWLVGINGTRAMTAFNSKQGGFFKTPVGRVQTPTLAILVEREKRIREFVPRDFWEIIGTFNCAAGNYTGRWFDEKFAKSETDDQLKAERVWDVAKAEEIKAKCIGKPGIVTEESKPTTSLSPLLYDLTSLQRDANSRFGFSAKNTLGVAQALYEKHKVLTYPRTDSRALPEDYIGTVKNTLGMLSEVTGYSSFADQILKSGWVHPNKRIFNNAKVSDHFAIIPTALAPKTLSEPEQKLYDLVTKRFLAIFYPAAEFLETTRITRVEGEPFKSAGKVLVQPGWLTVYGKQSDSDETPSLAPVKPGETVKTSEVEVKQNVTKPPARYTEATLLSAMEGAGKLVDDDELREAMSEKGLGTPATRAAIIEGLILEEYVHRVGRDLQATAKAFSLMELLNGLGVQELTKPELTGEWEFQLKEMQRKKISREQFMREIAEMTKRIVGRAKSFEHDTIPGDFGKLNVPCPKCGGGVHEKYRQYQCVKDGCDFAMWKTLCGRMFESEEIEKLIAEKQIGPLQGFRSKQGFPFAAVLKMNGEHKIEFDFGNAKEGESAEPVDFTGKEPLGKCPKCQSNVYDNAMNYVCEKQTGSKPTCDFRSGKIILQQEIAPEQIRKLLADGKTDLLKNFVSKKTNRKFEAFLVLKDGKTAFEFPVREGKGRRKSSEPPPKIDFTGKTDVGKCPKCGGKVFDTEAGYICENSQRETKRCTFKPIGKTILEQPIDAAQAAKILAAKKSDLLDKFISKAGKPFPAFLVMDAKGKITFDFPPRDDDNG